MAIDLSKFQGTLPYDSQMYGIYQPLLGWKSALQMDRLNIGIRMIRNSYLSLLAQRYVPTFTIQSAVSDAPRFELALAKSAESLQPPTVSGIDSLLTRQVLKTVLAAGANDPATWAKYTSQDFINKSLQDIQGQIKTEFLNALQLHTASASTTANRLMAYSPASGSATTPNEAVLSTILGRESVSAGVLSQLNQTLTPQQLQMILSPSVQTPSKIHQILQQLDPARSDLASATISPIGVVHLFREYFFEFATFLGTPVQHVWLSPGGTVELIEISTRKVTVERTIEQSFETIQKSEKDTTTQDELSDAVKQENSTDTKLGVSATSNTNYNTGFVNGSVTVNGSFSLEQQQKQAREQTHKTTRQQTQKLSSEIRQSYKSTFKTVTETTDTTSKRYVLQNTTDKLVNYELRRKMRQVGVQLQDYGTRLCWQAYVDNPGDTLGVPIFVHAAPLPDLQDIKAPEQPPTPDPLVRGDAIVVRGGWDHGNDTQWNFVPIGQAVSIVPPAGYVYDHAEIAVQQGPPWYYRTWPDAPNDTTVQIGQNPPLNAAPDSDFIKTIGKAADGTAENSVVQVLVGVGTGPGGLRDDTKYDIAIQVTPVFKPSLALLKSTNDTYIANVNKYNEQTKQAYQQVLFQSIRERVKLASNIQPRDFSEMREEERVVVYRALVAQLLNVAGVTNADPHVRHVFSEVVESMFDMENMLYFVAPDWWMPRPQVNSGNALSGLGVVDQQNQGAFTPGTDAGASNVVGWGGPRASRPDDYYITEDSTPAKLGSSLGWLLQLDGDNFRNAFLNAPWVKAVIPIQEGHEWKALAWLSNQTVEGSDGLNDLYQESIPGEIAGMLAVMRKYTTWPDASLAGRYNTLDPTQFTILDAIRYLIVAIQAKQAAAQTKMKDPTDATLSYLPTDKVYEHGFDPLQGGFVAQAKEPFEVFDQWIEVLPTDQVVPVEVTYDPKTGLQI